MAVIAGAAAGAYDGILVILVAFINGPS